MIRPQTHPILPKDCGLLGLGLSSDSQAIIFKPLLHSLGICLKGTADRFLRSEMPPRKLMSHGRCRNSDSKSFLNRLTHRLTGPKKKRQLQLFSGTMNNRLGNLGSPPWQKRIAFRAAASSFSKWPFTSFCIGTHLLGNSLACDTKNPSYFNFLDPIENSPNALLIKLGLCNSRETTSSLNMHAGICGRRRIKMQSILCSDR